MNIKKSNYVPYKVKDISLAEWGRKEIILAESEMPCKRKITWINLV